MYWEEETDKQQYIVPDNVVDLLYKIDCPTLPVDHAWPLANAIGKILKWFHTEPLTGMHIIHGADSGNGWERPTGDNALLHLSKRTHLTLRVPKSRVEAAHSLCGEELDVSGHRMGIGAVKPRKLSTTNILYSRYVVADPEWDEEEFTLWAVTELKAMQLRFKKVLSGKESTLKAPEGAIITRSLMVGDLAIEDAVKLQELGLGEFRSHGCGLFIPQKSF